MDASTLSLWKECQRQVVFLEDWVPGYGITIMSRQEWRARSTGPLSCPLSYMVRKVALYTSQVHKLHAFMMRHLREIMKITWKDKVTNKEILERANLPSMEDLLIRKNIVGRTCHENALWEITKANLFSQLPADERAIGRPRHRYKDIDKRNLKQRQINTKTWITTANQRSVWRTSVKWNWRWSLSLRDRQLLLILLWWIHTRYTTNTEYLV